MTMKKTGVIILFCILLFSLVAGANKIEITTNKDSFKPGENITFKVSLYDSGNNLIQGQAKIILEDAEKRARIEKVVSANELVDIKLDDNAYSGYWKITASYSRDNEIAERNAIFNVENNEKVNFELEGDVLTIENLGNIVYEKNIQIVIGDSLGSKRIVLDTGEKTNLRLTAPDGIYNIRITDGKETLTKSNVQLTGNVVGVLDENAGEKSPITSINPETNDNLENILKKNKFIYFFLAVIIGAAILLAVERNYRKKAGY